MPIQNSEIAEVFNKVADLLAIEGANKFRVRAYRDAASSINSLTQSVEEMLEEGKELNEIEGVGEDLAEKVKEIVETGELELLEEIKQRTPEELTEILNISGLGAKRVRTLHEELGINTLDDLEKAAKQGKIQQLEGFGEKTEQKILEDVEKSKEKEERILLSVAEQTAEPLVEYLKECEVIEEAVVTGSYRRRKETVGDLDILALSASNQKAMEHFVDYEEVEEVSSRGETRSTVVFRSELQVDLRVVPKKSYGAALLYFTGSKSHNIALRNLALERGFKVNEYGVFKEDERVAGETEQEVFDFFDLSYIEPELRENRGEIDAAKNDELPDLITVEEIKGDLQSHTKASDGHGTLEEMANAAIDKGYEYLAITDHSKHVSVVQGLDAEALADRIEVMNELNEKLEDIIILKSIEVDILEDGSLDLSDDILKELDLTVCSVHSKFNLSEEKQTERIIRAMDNQYFNILAHPTGRRIGKREPYEVDMERLLEAAKERGCFMEVNANPQRLDLNDIHCKMAKEIGLKLAISTDAHRTTELDYMRFGVGQARRGWLEAEDILNTRSWDELQKLLSRT